MDQEPESPTPVYQLVYVSAATVPFSDEELEELLAVARANNAASDISGMLLYHDGSFMQVLEGEESVVESVYEKIELDDRHSNATVLVKGPVEDRTFRSWSMGYLPSTTLADLPKGFHPFLKRGFRRTSDTENAARKALLAFKEGRWRTELYIRRDCRAAPRFL